MIANLSRRRGTAWAKSAGVQVTGESNDSENEDSPWLWLLDASKYAGTSPLNINTQLPPEDRPHFITVSFYKIFGYPTGLGALLVRRDAAALLRKRLVIISISAYALLPKTRREFHTGYLYMKLPRSR